MTSPEQVLDLWKWAKRNIHWVGEGTNPFRQVMTLCREYAEMKRDEAIDCHRPGDEIDRWEKMRDQMKDDQ